MCLTCGCSEGAEPRLTDLQAAQLIGVDPRQGHEHVHDPDHPHSHEHEHPHSHEHEHPHSHVNGHEHEHPHSHEHEHPHSHEHGHEDSHSHEHEHPHSHEHLHDPDHPHSHEHSHEHLHDPDHPHSHEHSHESPSSQVPGGVLEPIRISRPGKTIQLEQELLAKNSQLAERNRGWLAGRNILALNLVSSPGAGKTTLLERTIRDLGRDLAISVIEGDQETARDAERIRSAGCRVVQINTGTGCHLDATMLARALQQLDPPMGSVVFIENVGNLVCPALFDLGERAKVVIASVTEGEDKPIKYPHMFRASELMLLNKVDLLPYVQFDVDRCVDYAREVHPGLRVMPVSATRGDGLDKWYGWLREEAARRHQLSAGIL
jgi:hydrogenase nickel incorporation protein HypB